MSMAGRRPFEIDGIVELCRRDRTLASRVDAMGGRRFSIVFCCNAGAVRQALVQQESHDEIVGKPMDVLDQVEKVVCDDEFARVLWPFRNGKVDIVVTVMGRRVVNMPKVKQVM